MRDLFLFKRLKTLELLTDGKTLKYILQIERSGLTFAFVTDTINVDRTFSLKKDWIILDISFWIKIDIFFAFEIPFDLYQNYILVILNVFTWPFSLIGIEAKFTTKSPFLTYLFFKASILTSITVLSVLWNLL